MAYKSIADSAASLMRIDLAATSDEHEPCLLETGTELFESTAILEYLRDTYGA